jgi:hypothetical protein
MTNLSEFVSLLSTKQALANSKIIFIVFKAVSFKLVYVSFIVSVFEILKSFLAFLILLQTMY